MGFVIKYKGKHADKLLQSGAAPFGPGMQNYFGVTVAVKFVALLDELLFYFSIVIDLPVKTKMQGAKTLRLLAPFTEVNNAEAALGKTDPGMGMIVQSISFSIGAAVPQHTVHLFQSNLV